MLRQILLQLLERELALEQYVLAVHLVSARRMAEVNEQFLQHTGSTDVITFDYREGYSSDSMEQIDVAGEIFISVADARDQARTFRTTIAEELIRYVVHGVLHLRGYDDLVSAKRRVMKREENRLLRRLLRSVEAETVTA